MSLTPDYTPYLTLTENGQIWWRLEDAIKLGAGYLPVRDDDRNLIPVLRAASNRILANERELLAEFSQAHSATDLPFVLVREDGRFVNAGEFLRWLSEHIAQNQSMDFPNELVIAVRNALSTHAVNDPDPYESLLIALEGWFDRSLDQLPEKLQQRVKAELFPMPWDDASPDGRRNLAAQADYQRHPAFEQDRQFGWDFFVQKDKLERQIEEWTKIAAPTAVDLAKKEVRLEELKKKISEMQLQQQPIDKKVIPELVSFVQDRLKSQLRHSETKPEYIAYPRAMKLLADRLDATPEELAGWIFMGPENGGLVAYLNANELDEPPRFFYGYLAGAENPDYLSPLNACWFIESDIENFQPTDRFITGKALIERWGEQPYIQPRAFIRAKITESQLADLHPICGGTDGSFSENDFSPPLETGLFTLSHVEAIEREDFGMGDSRVASAPHRPVTTAGKIMQHFVVKRDEDVNDSWWRERMRFAGRYGLAESRHSKGKPGRRDSSLWFPAEVAGWLVDKQHMTAKAVAGVLRRHFQECSDTADLLDPPDE